MRSTILYCSLTILILANSASAHHIASPESSSAAPISGVLLLIAVGLAVSLIFRNSSKFYN